MKIFSVIFIFALASVGMAQSGSTTTSRTSTSSSSAQNAAPAPETAPPPATNADMNNYNSSSQNYSSTTTVKEERGSEISPGGLFIEPALGYARTETSVKTGAIPLLQDTSGTLQGGALGLRLGVHVSEILFLAADGRYERADIRDSSYSDASGDLWDGGATLGLQMPIAGLRIWGTYLMGGQYDPGAGAQGVDVKFSDARGWRAGAGLHFKALSINLEYEDVTFNKTEIQSVGPVAVAADTDLDFTNKGYTLSLSFPIEL